MVNFNYVIVHAVRLLHINSSVVKQQTPCCTTGCRKKAAANVQSESILQAIPSHGLSSTS
jgi:hypothetical protein